MKNSFVGRFVLPVRRMLKLPLASKRKGIDLQELLKVFDGPRDPEAIHTLELCVILPDKRDPTASMNFSGELMAGHCFLVMRRDNITRSFGLYPARRLSPWAPLKPYPSCVRNNRKQKGHASVRMHITARDFERVRALAVAGASSTYRLLDFNCADYALSIFNSVRAVPLVPPPYRVHWRGIPIGCNRLPSRKKQMVIPHTPHGLFEAIRGLEAAFAARPVETSAGPRPGDAAHAPRPVEAAHASRPVEAAHASRFVSQEPGRSELQPA